MMRSAMLCLLLVLPVAAAQGVVAGAIAPVTPPTGPAGITVTATGTAYGEPDRASFDAGVLATNRDVQAALDEVNERVERLINTLQGAGIAPEDIRTSNFAVFPDQAYRPDGTPGELRYRVTNTVSVTVRDTEQLGELLSASVEAGANEIWNVTFGISNRAALESRAREEAMQAARERAQQLASLSGVRLGVVTRVVEGPLPDAGIPLPAARAEFASDASVPIASGQLAVTVTLQVTFGIE
ncbi:SIMPL domain-containing protein [Truepera radiovictrix]|uniref:26 kDa periplasmic immunogenic protein n=1 Tax=Truepera radiovictrix (strain DSM 17093 / CIP 108686 / LMG 22925 / RQ-24) TaxID=649638 RepID=D7CS09_TRURR|nr:SIMPL domain-containing protein [Truepera radiovictrix]ADI15337.1 protein of unknown function DUF541 [Truepera radiovictrix DSM 17093]WMT56112.1 SIMPL domain-containing protein [Truepera radiovictrix]